MDRPGAPDPSLSAARAARLQRRLIAATFARAGFREAQNLCETLMDDHYTDYKTGWLAIAVMYGRPFTQNEVGRLPSTIFDAFDSDEMESIHRLLVSARNNTFAHTGVHPALSAVVLPPGAWSERGSTTTGEVPFAHELLPQIVALCDLQIERCDCLIEEHVQVLYGYRSWPEGTMFILDWPGKSYEPRLSEQ